MSISVFHRVISFFDDVMLFCVWVVIWVSKQEVLLEILRSVALI